VDDKFTNFEVMSMINLKTLLVDPL